MNKVSSKAVLRWPVRASAGLPAPVRARFLERFRHRLTADGDLLLTSSRFRDRGRNVADCIERLAAMLAEVASPPRVRKPTRRTRSAAEARLSEKRLTSRKKQTRRTGSFLEE